MKSILQAAERSVEMITDIVPSEASAPPAADGSIISDEEHQEIVKEIDRLSGQSRINVTPDLFRIQAAKKGILFPLLVNIVAFSILGAGIFATRYYFEVKDQEAYLASVEQQSAEGNLIQEIKKETEERLAEKEDEIKSIQENMQKIEDERLALEQDMNSKISEREDQLRAELEAAIASEREKLQSQGMTSDQIEQEISRMELEQSSIFEQELASYKEEAELEKIELEQSLDQLQSEYNNKLSSVNEERARIEAEAKSREEELQARMEERTRELESEMTQAQEELQQLTDAKEQEGLVENQIVGFYKNIETSIKAGELDAASVELQNLEDYLYDESVIGLEGLSRRREIDLFVIDSLSKLVESTKEDAQGTLDTMSLIDAADRLQEIRQTVENADQQLAVGNREMAELMYRNALEQIPEINKSHSFFIDAIESELESGYEELSDIQSRLEELQQENLNRALGVTNLLTEADSQYDLGDFSSAIQTYRDAMIATGYEDMEEATDRMLSSSNNLAIAPFRETIDSLRNEMETMETEYEETITNLSEMEADTSEFEEALAEKDNIIDGYEENLTEKDSLISTYEESIAEKENLISSYLQEIENYNQQIADINQQLEDYNQQLDGQSGDFATLNEDYEDRVAEIASLNDELENSQSRIASLSSQLTTEQEQIQTLQEQLTQQTDEITSYEQRITDMRNQLEEERSRVETSREESQALDREMADLTTLQSRLNRLNRSYTDFEILAANLEDNIRGDAATIDALYDFFEEDSVEEILPGISDYMRTFSNVYVDAGQEIGLYEAVSVLFDLNSIGNSSERLNYLNDLKSGYSDDDAMLEMISQLERNLERE